MNPGSRWRTRICAALPLVWRKELTTSWALLWVTAPDSPLGVYHRWATSGAHGPGNMQMFQQILHLHSAFCFGCSMTSSFGFFFDKARWFRNWSWRLGVTNSFNSLVTAPISGMNVPFFFWRGWGWDFWSIFPLSLSTSAASYFFHRSFGSAQDFLQCHLGWGHEKALASGLFTALLGTSIGATWPNFAQLAIESIEEVETEATLNQLRWQHGMQMKATQLCLMFHLTF